MYQNIEGWLEQLHVIKNNGDIVKFDKEKITNAIIKAIYATAAKTGDDNIKSKQNIAKAFDVTEHVLELISTKEEVWSGDTLVVHRETIQDEVERAINHFDEDDDCYEYFKVAKEYIVYRSQRDAKKSGTMVTMENGSFKPIEDVVNKVWLPILKEMSHDLTCVDLEKVIKNIISDSYQGIDLKGLEDTVGMCIRNYMEEDPEYNTFMARFRMKQIDKEVEATTESILSESVYSTLRYLEDYKNPFCRFILAAIEQRGIRREYNDIPIHELFDLPKLNEAIDRSRDDLIDFLGLQTLYDRYFLKTADERRYENIQFMFMRVAMGHAIAEKENHTEHAINYYNTLSDKDYMSSTPTLFNSLSEKSQMSSCYLTTIPDDLYGIYDAMQDNAMLSKFAGGLGNDWTPVRALGAHIKGTNGKSQGVVPFMKVANDTAVAVNQGGKRKGATCAYLETWHLDIEEFLELRKNTGDDRRRTHDMNTANWIPDLFMKRVFEESHWTLFSPNDVPDLHDLFGEEFEERYRYYEGLAEEGKIKLSKKVSAQGLWRKMLGMLFETGHPWLTFKDPCNFRNPQQHVGRVHSSNLCTEITLNTKADEEIAVCNLGSVNLVNHIDENGNLLKDKLKQTVTMAIRMLDNVIDVNYYAVPEALNSNMRHRPIGLGVMGIQDALYIRGISYSSQEAIEFCEEAQKYISMYAIEASALLAKEKGRYQSYEGSLWDQGILPIDSALLYKQSRAGYESMTINDDPFSEEWSHVRDLVAQYGMRNSNVMAIAPTATIANIIGVSQSIEPTYQNLYVKSNLSGEFTIINKYLVSELKKLGLWTKETIGDLKYHEGSLNKAGAFGYIPQYIKDIYRTAFENDPFYLIEAAARRQIYLDQAQSLNLYIAGASGKLLDSIYKKAWMAGCKTTYYLRALAATTTEKSTVDRGTHNAVSNGVSPSPEPAPVPLACSIDDPDCEACQ